MKRIYIAVLFIVFGLAVGLIEYIGINTNVESYIGNIDRIGKLVEQNKTESAEKLSKQTAESFERYSKNILYIYYRQDELEEITEELYRLEDLLDDKRVEDYHEASHILKTKLLSVKEKEQVTVQNIL